MAKPPAPWQVAYDQLGPDRVLAALRRAATSDAYRANEVLRHLKPGHRPAAWLDEQLVRCMAVHRALDAMESRAEPEDEGEIVALPLLPTDAGEEGIGEGGGVPASRPTAELLDEIQQELEDVCGWSAVCPPRPGRPRVRRGLLLLWARIERLRERVAREGGVD